MNVDILLAIILFNINLYVYLILFLMLINTVTIFSVQLLVVLIMGDNSDDEVLEISRDQFVQTVDEVK
ncbi:hypothetical protein Hanom_Chr17g01584521 [Helianthus anomalus]